MRGQRTKPRSDFAWLCLIFVLFGSLCCLIEIRAACVLHGQAGHDSTRFLHVRNHGFTYRNDWSMCSINWHCIADTVTETVTATVYGPHIVGVQDSHCEWAVVAIYYQHRHYSDIHLACSGASWCVLGQWVLWCDASWSLVWWCVFSFVDERWHQHACVVTTRVCWYLCCCDYCDPFFPVSVERPVVSLLLFHLLSWLNHRLVVLLSCFDFVVLLVVCVSQRSSRTEPLFDSAWFCLILAVCLLHCMSLTENRDTEAIRFWPRQRES
jgi:hypothetical protein